MIKALLASYILMIAADGGALSDPAQEARAQDLMREIRCVACENEPISNSSSDIAADMRDRVRVMVAEGNSDAEIRDWFAERYGDFVLFRPSSRGLGGMLLWGLPFILLIAGASVIYLVRRKPSETASSVEAVAPEDI